MQDYEKLGVFYIGKKYDLDTETRGDSYILYDSRDLVTHAACIGMTGSGKTGLCVTLLEEAAIDNIPAIIIDPKGDLGNLLLTFPGLQREDFQQWVNPDDALKQAISIEEFAAQQSDLWKKGLAEWDQDEQRINRLRGSAEFTIFTPGSSAGIPVSILKSFDVPEKNILQDRDALRERLTTTVTGLLGLLGMDTDPLKSREHILLSTIIETAWTTGKGLDIPSIIQQIQAPPVTKIGVFDLESFYPANERFELAMTLNNLLAAPGFDIWFEGEPLDIQSLLYTGSGKPRISIFSIAHLNDGERMFFVTLLLTQLLGWMRLQPGTGSLRALLYMDEIYGFLPAVANPPSKQPFLTLLKQARAFGLGLIIATQNPVDLDYKALSNIGTWFIGRLQTEQDKARIMDGLESALNTSELKFSRQYLESILSRLRKRVFLLNNVHEDQPEIFQTRWAMSYLRGPLTRNQIKILMKDRTVSSGTDMLKQQETPVSYEVMGESKTGKTGSATRPVVPPAIQQRYLPVRGVHPEGTSIMYYPMLLGNGSIYYADAKKGIAAEEKTFFMTEFPDRTDDVDWDDAERIQLDEDDLEKFSTGDEIYADLPAAALNEKNYTEWQKNLKDWIYRNHKLELLKSPSLNMVSQINEQEREFRIRLQVAAREKRDQMIDKLRDAYAVKIQRLQDRLRKAEQRLDREKDQAKQQKLQTAISFGATVLSMVLGRKKASTSTLGRATTATRGVGRSIKESQDIDRAKEDIEALKKKILDLESELQQEVDELYDTIDPQTEKFENVKIKPKKTNIALDDPILVWVPHWQDDKGRSRPAWP